ncbi:hypothetical protein CALCODRAFT_479671 [Calocera cornea HHB12733]|uniref:Uncharacterized protein n=1 Tax=Calocera cornea HHB12733 TaxID=1353952 RepID=A0A165JBL3_9BASI|nr:hypothetical protein CALCODRAFT_479671 [Calocera cornea HHB12733]
MDEDSASLLGPDNTLDGPDETLLSLEKALCRTITAPDEPVNKAPDKPVTHAADEPGKKGLARASLLQSVDLGNDKGTRVVVDKPGVSRVASIVGEPRRRAPPSSGRTGGGDIELRPIMATAREEGVLNVLRATGTHFTAAGNAVMGDDVDAMEKGMVGERPENIAHTEAEKKLGIRSAAGYAGLKVLVGDIVEAFGMARGLTDEEVEEAKKKKKSAWERIVLPFQIVIGWILWAIGKVFGPVVPWVKANPRHAFCILVVCIIALARGVSPWTVLTTGIDSWKATKKA